MLKKSLSEFSEFAKSMNILQNEFNENSELFHLQIVQEKFINENKKLREVERFIKKLVLAAEESKTYSLF